MSAKTPADDLIERLRATQLSICNDAADAMSAMDQQRRAFLGQIERLESQRGTLIGEGNCIDPVKWSPLGEQIVRLEAERGILHAALQTIAGEREDTQYQRAPSLAHAQRIARAALEESK